MAEYDENHFDKAARRHAAALERLSGPAKELDRLTKTLEASPVFALEKLMSPERAYARVLDAANPIPALDSHVQRILASLSEQTVLAREALGPLEDLRRLGVLDNFPAVVPDYSNIAEAVERMQQQFRLPEIGEAERLAQQAAQLTERWNMIELPEFSALTSLETAMAQMRSPWLDIERTLESALGFAALQSIGSALVRFNSFDDGIAAKLRRHLGDWRDSIVWPANLEDIAVRTALYVERGIDTSLTDFPSPAFEESISVARLDRPAPRVIELQHYRIVGETDEERSAFERTNAAQARLLRFEYYLRRFIDREMRVTFGENWIETQVDEETRSRWREKQEIAHDKGERGHALIDYADFTDYERVIIRRDNWKQVFRPVFRKPESVQESLQRLYPVRLCSCHARPITHDDELLLYVEVKRILKAIGIVED